jgi:hypothetical protein
LIIEPRFSAKPNDGRTALARLVVFVREQIDHDVNREFAEGASP